MQATRLLLVVLAALCLATIVAASAAPKKPNPPTLFSFSAFALYDNGYGAFRRYYDQDNQRLRTDVFDLSWNLVGEHFGFWKVNKTYIYETQADQCYVLGLKSPWENAWDFLKNAVYFGDDNIQGQDCNLWITKLDNQEAIVSCFSKDIPVYIGSYSGDEPLAVYLITEFSVDVHPSNFRLPNICDSAAYKLSTKSFMNLKNYRAPSSHPLIL